jgi:protein-tyrosine phosphatase
LRVLTWDGCVNVRDLGGLPTEDGSVTRFGRIVRADNLSGLSAAGREVLRAYGVTRIVDLRWVEEVAEDGPSDEDLEVVHVELLGAKDGTFAEIDGRQRRPTDPATSRRSAYLDFLDVFPENFASAVTAIADAPDGVVVVHCAGGVDRTGLVAGLLLRLAGVGLDEIGVDYAESEGNWAPHVGQWIDEAPDEEEREHRRRLARCAPETMSGALAEIEHRHGSVRGYLLGGGASAASLDAARARLRDP